MKVFVAEQDIHYEGTSIIGIFKTKQKAKNAVERVVKLSGEQVDWQEGDLIVGRTPKGEMHDFYYHVYEVVVDKTMGYPVLQ